MSNFTTKSTKQVTIQSIEHHDGVEYDLILDQTSKALMDKYNWSVHSKYEKDGTFTVKLTRSVDGRRKEYLHRNLLDTYRNDGGRVVPLNGNWCDLRKCNWEVLPRLPNGVKRAAKPTQVPSEPFVAEIDVQVSVEEKELLTRDLVKEVLVDLFSDEKVHTVWYCLAGIQDAADMDTDIPLTKEQKEMIYEVREELGIEVYKCPKNNKWYWGVHKLLNPNTKSVEDYFGA